MPESRKERYPLAEQSKLAVVTKSLIDSRTLLRRFAWGRRASNIEKEEKDKLKERKKIFLTQILNTN
jgi:hypothetical protein